MTRTYLVRTLYLMDWFIANYQRMGLRENMLAKAPVVMPAASENVGHGIREGVKMAFGTTLPSIRTALTRASSR